MRRPLPDDAPARIFDDRNFRLVQIVDMLSGVFFGFACDDSGKEQDRDDVGNRHKAVKDVSDVPDEL